METFCHLGDREKLRGIHALVTDVAAKDTYTPFIDVLISGARPSDGAVTVRIRGERFRERSRFGVPLIAATDIVVLTLTWPCARFSMA